MNRLPDRRASIIAGVGVAILGMLGILLLWDGFPMVWSPDSVGYVAAAESFMAGRGMIDIDGGAFTLWPPGFSIALSLGTTVFGSLDSASRAFNTIAYAVVVIVSTVVMHRVVMSTRLRWLGTVAVAIAPPLIFVTIHVWSDPLFAALTVSALGLLLFAIDGRSRRLLVLAGAVAALSVMTRYVGVLVGASGVLAILLGSASSWRHRITDSVVYGSSAIGLGLLLFAWNLFRSGSPVGDRVASCVDVAVTLGATVAEIGRWFGFGSVSAAGSAILVAGFILVVLAWRLPIEPIVRTAFLVFGVFVVLYLCALVVGSAVSNTDLPDARLMVPVYAPIVILGLAAMDGIAGYLDRTTKRSSSSTMLTAIALLLLVVAPAMNVVATAVGQRASIRQDARHEAAMSSLLATDRPDRGLLVSNKPHVVFLRWGEPVHQFPRTEQCALPVPHSHSLDVEALKQFATEHGAVTLAWMGSGELSIEDDDGFRILRLRESEDGVILYIEPIAAADVG